VQNVVVCECDEDAFENEIEGLGRFVLRPHSLLPTATLVFHTLDILLTYFLNLSSQFGGCYTVFLSLRYMLSSGCDVSSFKLFDLQ
jgi:hypothetical protein